MKKVYFSGYAFFIALILLMPFAHAASYPLKDLNPYYDELADFINTSLDSTTGQLWARLNASFYDFNITNNLIVLGNISGEIPNTFKNINFSTQLNLYMDVFFGNGNWTILYNNEASTRWGRTNQTEYNDTINSALNLKQTEDSAFKISNGTSLVVGGEVSGTVASITLSDTALDDQYVLRENSSLVQDSDLGSKIQNISINRSIDLSSYNKSISLVNYNQSIDLSGYLSGIGQVTSKVNSTSWNRTGTNVILANTGDNVGIGTASPSEVLEINGRTKINNILYSGGYKDDTNLPIQIIGSAAQFGVARVTNTYGLLIGSYDSTTYSMRTVNSSDKISFIVNNTNQVLNILPGGKVGIGTITPFNLLDVSASNSGGVGAIAQLTNPTLNTGSAVELRFAPTNSPSNRYASIQGINIDGSNSIGLAFFTGAGASITEKMRILHSGNVGIGTTSPKATLNVVGDVYHNLSTVSQDFNIVNATGNSRFFVDNSNGYIGIGTTTPGTYFTVAATTANQGIWIVNGSGATRARLNYHTDSDRVYLHLTNGSSGEVLLNPSGNSYFKAGSVGIGTTSPREILDITGGNLTIDIPSTTANRDISFKFNGGSAKIAGITVDADGSGSGAMIFNTGQTGTGVYTERMRINENGKVGIGTTTPYDLLHLDNGVPSKLRISNSASSTNNSAQIYNIAHNVNDASPNMDNFSMGGSLFIGISENGVTGSTANMWDGTTHKGAAYIAAHGFSLNSATYEGNLRFYTRGSSTTAERMIITNSGNVGIGTMSPATNLDTAGTIRSTALGTVPASGTGIEMYYTSGVGHILAYNRSGSANQQLNFGLDGSGIVISSTGNVGIGTTNPKQKLDVRGAIKFGNDSAGPEAGTIGADNNWGMLLRPYGGGAIAAFLIVNSSNSAKVVMLENGNVGIGTTSPTAGVEFDVEGNAECDGAGCWAVESDLSLKENVADLSKYGLKDVMKIKPREYDYKNATKIDNGNHSFGFIAQELKLIVPEIVYGEEGSMSIGYGGLTPVLVKAIQEQQTQIETMKSSLCKLGEAEYC